MKNISLCTLPEKKSLYFLSEGNNYVITERKTPEKRTVIIGIVLVIVLLTLFFYFTDIGMSEISARMLPVCIGMGLGLGEASFYYRKKVIQKNIQKGEKISFSQYPIAREMAAIKTAYFSELLLLGIMLILIFGFIYLSIFFPNGSDGSTLNIVILSYIFWLNFREYTPVRKGKFIQQIKISKNVTEN